MLDDGDFVRDGAVEPLKAESAGAGDGGLEVFRSDFEGEVAPIESHRSKGGFDHGLGGVFDDGVAEAGGEFLFEIEFFGHLGGDTGIVGEGWQVWILAPPGKWELGLVEYERRETGGD